MHHAPSHLVFCPPAIVRRTGPHDVGTVRTRLHINGPDGVRSLVVQMWYPAGGAPGTTGRLLTLYSRLRHPMWAPVLRGVSLPSTRNKFPLITYVPDAPGTQQDNTYTLANLASHGFILAAIQNPFARGRKVAKGAEGISQPPPSPHERCVRRGVRAACALLDALEDLRPNDPAGAWAGRLDVKRAGILGYALGGTVAHASAAADGRYVAVASFDGPKDAGPHAKVPYLLLRSESSGETRRRSAMRTGSAQSNITGARPRSGASLIASHIIEVAGTRPEHFSDWLIISSLFAVGLGRSIAMRIRAIIDAYTVAFFKTYVQADPHPLMCVRHSPYPEVRFVENDDCEIEPRGGAAGPTPR